MTGTPRLHALVSFYDEPIANLLNCLRAMADAGTDHVIAMDGRYAMFPGEDAASSIEQHARIVAGCRQLGMACTLHVPAEPFVGNEVEKRNGLFALAYALAEPGVDWFWVQDADQFVTDWPKDLKARLAASEQDVAQVDLVDMPLLRANHPGMSAHLPQRALFRAQRITVGPSHAIYRADDGRLLWGWEPDCVQADALDLTGVVRVEHHPDTREQARVQAKMRYYVERDAARIERGTCEECGDPAVKLVARGWRVSSDGVPVSTSLAEACRPCGKRIERDARYELSRLGFSPAALKAKGLGLALETRQGVAPK